MQIIKEKTTNIVIYAGPSLGLSSSGANNGVWVDSSTTLSNAAIETVDSVPADWVGGAYVYTTAGGWVRTAAATAKADAAFQAAKDAAILLIDADVDSIYGLVAGNRATEYALAEEDALAYKAAGYTGTVPGSVQAWAAAKGWTPTQSADDILLTAAQWRGAQGTIRASRLLRKEQIRVATTQTALDAAVAAWVGFRKAARTSLGLPN
jgi:hypothetical protein